MLQDTAAYLSQKPKWPDSMNGSKSGDGKNNGSVPDTPVSASGYCGCVEVVVLRGEGASPSEVRSGSGGGGRSCAQG